MLNKQDAHAVAARLLSCPFCGQKPVASIRGAGEIANNPWAKCKTENCMGAKLPAINLDDPEDVDAWNTRARPDAPTQI